MKDGKIIKIFKRLVIMKDGKIIKIFHKVGYYEGWEDYQNGRIIEIAKTRIQDMLCGKLDLICQLGEKKWKWFDYLFFQNNIISWIWSLEL